MASSQRSSFGVRLVSELEEWLFGKLYEAQIVVLELLRPEMREILETYHQVTGDDGVWSWRQEAIRKLIEKADVRPAHEMGEHSSISPRATCPLCGQGSTAPYAGRGYAIPEGLRRHLEGSGAFPCRVLNIAIDLCRQQVRFRKKRFARSIPLSNTKSGDTS